MSKKSNLTHEYKKRLKNQCKFGQSKDAAKKAAKEYAKEHNTAYEQPRGIYATKTLKDYDAACNYFLNYCLDKHRYEVKTWDDCRQFASEYIESIKPKLSAWTIHLYATAIASSYDTKVKDLLPDTELPKRERKNIVRGRSLATKGLEADERYEKSITILKATGCRRKEALRLRKEDFREQLDKNGKPTGNLEVFKRGKNGLHRWCMVNPKYTDDVKNFLCHQPTFKVDGEDRLFRKNDIPKSEIHSYRADYARDLYDYYEKQGFATGNLYRCKKDMAGVVYDKGLLSKVSYDLQHGRNNVVISYLWK